MLNVSNNYALENDCMTAVIFYILHSWVSIYGSENWKMEHTRALKFCLLAINASYLYVAPSSCRICHHTLEYEQL